MLSFKDKTPITNNLNWCQNVCPYSLCYITVKLNLSNLFTRETLQGAKINISPKNHHFKTIKCKAMWYKV